jgi:hypothetical protein
MNQPLPTRKVAKQVCLSDDSRRMLGGRMLPNLRKVGIFRLDGSSEDLRMAGSL